MKRSPGLRALSSEHHTALVLARRALAVSRDEVAEAWLDLMQRFIRELEPHFRQEEEQLLPALAQAGEKASASMSASCSSLPRRGCRNLM